MSRTTSTAIVGSTLPPLDQRGKRKRMKCVQQYNTSTALAGSILLAPSGTLDDRPNLPQLLAVPRCSARQLQSNRGVAAPRGCSSYHTYIIDHVLVRSSIWGVAVHGDFQRGYLDVAVHRPPLVWRSSWQRCRYICITTGADSHGFSV